MSLQRSAGPLGCHLGAPKIAPLAKRVTCYSVRSSGGGTRTPDTRIMIPERVGYDARSYYSNPLHDTSPKPHETAWGHLGCHLGFSPPLPGGHARRVAA